MRALNEGTVERRTILGAVLAELCLDRRLEYLAQPCCGHELCALSCVLPVVRGCCGLMSRSLLCSRGGLIVDGYKVHWKVPRGNFGLLVLPEVCC